MKIEVYCKPGDKVYIKGIPMIVTFLHIDKEDINYCCQFCCNMPYKCIQCPLYKGKISCLGNEYVEFTAKDIGKTVFLSNKEDKL